MQIQSSDRSFQYGDAIFSTVRIRAGRPQLWSLHWQRLCHSMQRLGFAAMSDAAVLQQVLATISAQEQVLKVLISRGEGARGYGTLGILSPQLYLLFVLCSIYSGEKYQTNTLSMTSFPPL